MLKDLKKCLKSEKRDSKILDIVIYGSLVKGKPKARDIDVMVIFLEGSLKERLNRLQEIKAKIKKKFEDYTLDVKQMVLKDFFSPSFLAKTGILIEGISIFSDRKFSEVLGFNSFALFTYNLRKLKHHEKVKFNYILAGRNARGVIELLGGRRLASGVVKIPIENSYSFEEILKNNKVNYSKKQILEER